MFKGIAAKAAKVLASHPHFRELRREFCFNEEGGTLTVEGYVPTFHLKQILQHALLTIEGVNRIENRVKIKNQSNLVDHRPITAALK